VCGVHIMVRERERGREREIGNERKKQKGTGKEGQRERGIEYK